MTRPPIILLGISISPELSNCRTSELIMRSTRSGSNGRLRKATYIDRASLSRSKGSRCPFFLITVSSRNCTRSKVVKRAPQFGQNRRRRIAPRSSVGRETFTWVSSVPQNGQRISSSACSVAPMHRATLPTARATRSELRVDREAGAQLVDLLLHAGLGRAIVGGFSSQRAQYLDDASADGMEFVLPEAARCRRRRAEADAGGNRRFLWVERDPVLVAGDPGAFEAFLGIPAGDPQGPQIHQHQVRVGSTGNNHEPGCRERCRERFGILDDLSRVASERRLQGLAQGDRLGGDHMHQWTAL